MGQKLFAKGVYGRIASYGFGFGFVEADGKSNDKASATRSKHSVTEQRRRSKINERFGSCPLRHCHSGFVYNGT